jgi:hypothetical protein
MSKYEQLQGNDFSDNVAVPRNTSRMSYEGVTGFVEQHWVKIVGILSIILFALYEYLNSIGTYGDSKHIYRYFGAAFFVLLFTYMIDVGVYRASGMKYMDYRGTILIFGLLVLSTLMLLSGFGN